MPPEVKRSLKSTDTAMKPTSIIYPNIAHTTPTNNEIGRLTDERTISEFAENGDIIQKGWRHLSGR
jgi:hypothetical protein